MKCYKMYGVYYENILHWQMNYRERNVLSCSATVRCNGQGVMCSWENELLRNCSETHPAPPPPSETNYMRFCAHVRFTGLIINLCKILVCSRLKQAYLILISQCKNKSSISAKIYLVSVQILIITFTFLRSIRSRWQGSVLLLKVAPLA